jgi:predicted N-acyltransferase
LKTPLSIKIYAKVADLPKKWDSLAIENVFLSTAYLGVLEQSAPLNMTCHFIGLFQKEILVGIALSQFVDLNKLESFGERDRCFKNTVRNIILKNFCSKILIIGNNMLSGENALYFSKNIAQTDVLQALKAASEKIKTIFKNKGLKVHIYSFKDFPETALPDFYKAGFSNYFQFSAQPNMHFVIPSNWQSEQDYVDALSKKYRDQFKRARKKITGIQKRKMSLEDIITHEEIINKLYYHVAKNAHFNTFFLAKNHFRVFKEKLQDKFLFYGYFYNDELIGFNTLIKNGKVMDTYFLGYDDRIQREKMLYLNMLYDMVAYSIKKGFTEIIFARTALEIKSSIGARPIQLYSFAKHSNLFIDFAFGKLYSFLEPQASWNERNPFK